MKAAAFRVKAGRWSIFKALVNSLQASQPHCHNSQVVQVEVACVRAELHAERAAAFIVMTVKALALRRAGARGEGGGLQGDDG